LWHILQVSIDAAELPLFIKISTDFLISVSIFLSLILFLDLFFDKYWLIAAGVNPNISAASL